MEPYPAVDATRRAMRVSRRALLSGFATAAFSLATADKVLAREAGRLVAPDFDFRQVDVFSPEPFRGNPLAVVVGADTLTDDQMKLFSKWTNLSETTFLLRPTDPLADYRVRIFSLGDELPFAGHPTLGSCHVWLTSGGRSKGAEIVQQCGIGRVRLRGSAGRLAFEAPLLRRTTALDADTLSRIQRGLRLTADDIVAARTLDGGLRQTAILIRNRARLLALRPDWPALAMDGIGLIAPWDSGKGPGSPDFEVRVFDSTLTGSEDPVTGSFNASAARWMIGAGLAPDHYVVSQGTVLGRMGRVYVDRDQDRIWIGGDVTDRIRGRLRV
ncbi:PhzF family phenazine biosynthesis protein [Sphingomonas sp. MMSM20]|uniref:PhzF family phenazine biosynthesis protein n=1 Tax=Sphingomonas lycopersici TaxID=2951807 RepID=UPI002238A70C|nr:PhzF family phenazine biosynthesis protein [Sphingomonas lycopersici]MCW6532251.1 PhzF family phenazine biosynthesis protein [Sphingomonas lycopersici]